MYNPNYFQSLSAMPGETAVSAEANTCVFWDVDDCPFPEDINPNSIHRNIKSALANEGYNGNVEFKVYGRDEKLTDGYQLDAGVTFVPKVAKHVREMLLHICEWAMVNPRGSNLLLISKITREEEMLVTPEEDEEEMLVTSEEDEEEMLVTSEEDEETYEEDEETYKEERFVIPKGYNKLVTTVGVLAERGYNVLLAPPELPDKLVLHFTPRSVWHWPILSYGGLPSAYSLELEPQLFKPNFQNLFETDSLTKTGVFWDLGEWSLPIGVELFDVIPRIESALASRGFPGNTSFRFFFDNKSIPYEDVKSYKEGRIAFFPISEGGVISRLEWMLLHIYFWAIDNPVTGAGGEEHRLMVVSDRFPKEPEFISSLGALITKGYKVLLVNSKEVPSITTLHPEWVWSSMLRGCYANHCHHCGQVPELKSEISNFHMFEETKETAEPTGIFWDLDSFEIPESLDPFEVRANIRSALNKKGFHVDWAVFFLYTEKTKLRWPESKVCQYENAGYVVLMDGEDKNSTADWMLLDMHLWFLDNAVPNPDRKCNMMIVSNHITEEPEFIPFLKTLITKCNIVLLVQPEKSKCHKGLLVQCENLAQPMEAQSVGTEKLVESFSTESADWLWQNLVDGARSLVRRESPVGGGSPVRVEEPSNKAACQHCGKY